MKRRRFVAMTTAGIVVLSLPTTYYFLGNLEYDSALAEPLTLSKIWDSESILDIGKKYRSLIPKEDQERKLVRLLMKGNVAGNNDLQSEIGEKIKQDFQSGNMVMVDGWVLSVTEARQCALLSVIEPQPQK